MIIFVDFLDRYVFIGTEAQAECVSSAYPAYWVGKRPEPNKLDPILSELTHLSRVFKSKKIFQDKITMYVLLVATEVRHGASATSLANVYSYLLMRKAQKPQALRIRVASERKLVLNVHPHDALGAVRGLATQEYVEWIEPKTWMQTRNSASSKILTTGISEESRLREQIATKELKLNGTGQVVGIADTGLDFDNCFLHQLPFAYPCFRAEVEDAQVERRRMLQ